MTTVSVFTDTLIHTYNLSEDRIVGLSSHYNTDIHPGSNKSIEGWKWDSRIWPTTREFEAVSYAPAIWDPILSDLVETQFQSGYGDSKDLLLLDVQKEEISGNHVWAPRVNHGWFYVFDEEWYLYSDTYQTQYFSTLNTISGQQYLDLDYDFKPTIPIQVHRYEFKPALGRHFMRDQVRRKIEFTVSGNDSEFIVDTDYSPPRLWLDGELHEAVGAPLTLISGIVDPSETANLELVGISDGSALQEYSVIYSPMDPFADLQVFTYSDPAQPTEWDIISGVEEFNGSGLQVNVDHDRGTLRFGDYDQSDGTGDGMIPPIYSRIAIHYTKGLVALYEPDFGGDYITARTANVNPVASSTYRGFVHLLTKPSDPASIILTAELPTIDSSTYLIDLGNNSGQLVATVKDSVGQNLEGEEVTFEILVPQIGTFGAISHEVVAVTNVNGDALTIYNAPGTIEDVGQATNLVTWSGIDTELEVSGIIDPGSVSGLFLYKVHEYEPAMGIPVSDEASYYVNYFDEEDVTSGITATQTWEEDWRFLNELLLPVTYEADDLSTGKKTIVLTSTRSNIVNPHTGLFTTSGFAPLYASLIEETGTEALPVLTVTYAGLHLPLPGTEDTKSYFLVGDAKTNIRAYVVNRRTGTRVYSNTISINVSIPSVLSGTYYAELLSSAPLGLLTKTTNIDTESDATINATSGVEEWDGRTFYKSYTEERLWDDLNGYETYVDWFRRSRKGDSVGLELASLGLTVVEIDSGILDQSGEIPMGFRLKSAGITVASVLDQVTYLDPNDHLPSGYFSTSGMYP